jgi:hypothetical protein
MLGSVSRVSMMRVETVNRPCTVEDWNEIAGEIGRHAESLGLKDDESKGKEHAKEEEEHCGSEESKRNLLQRVDEFHEFEGSWVRWNPCLHQAVCDNKHAKDHEGRNSHRPSKADFSHEMLDHDRKDHAT